MKLNLYTLNKQTKISLIFNINKNIYFKKNNEKNSGDAGD